MLFLVISNPRPERPSDMSEARQAFWPWMQSHQTSGVCKHIYPRVGRGAVAIFDVANHAKLHQLLNDWADIIPAEFEIYPLVELAAATALLDAQTMSKVDWPSS